MTPLQELTTQDTLAWLLEKENPSVRYFTLTKLLGAPENDKDVLETQANIYNYGIASSILSQQNAMGYWGNEDNFYLDKYRGSVWQLIILAELGCSVHNTQVKRACEFILENSQDRESGGFAFRRSGRTNGGRHSEVIPCLTGNMVRSLLKLGHVHDERVQKGIEWICTYQRSDDGILEPVRGWPYDRYEMCWGKHTCHMGVVKALKALSAIAPHERSKRCSEQIASLAEYLLIHHIYKKSHELEKTSRPGWLKFGFPLMYQTDVLEIASILTELNYHDDRMRDAVDLIRGKRTINGRWKLENTFNGRMINNIEVKGKESKWITLRALQVLASN
jgi:hypothetical protein